VRPTSIALALLLAAGCDIGEAARREREMMAPEIYEGFRRDAPMHVQLWRTGPSRRARHEGSVKVRGRIVRIFRDTDRLLHFGQKVTFNVPVIDRESRSEPVLSGTIRHDWDWLGRAHWLEAFLEAREGTIHLVHSQVLPLRHPTWQPVCGPDARGYLCEGTLRAK